MCEIDTLARYSSAQTDDCSGPTLFDSVIVFGLISQPCKTTEICKEKQTMAAQLMYALHLLLLCGEPYR